MADIITLLDNNLSYSFLTEIIYLILFSYYMNYTSNY